MIRQINARAANAGNWNSAGESYGRPSAATTRPRNRINPRRQRNAERVCQFLLLNAVPTWDADAWRDDLRRCRVTPELYARLHETDGLERYEVDAAIDDLFDAEWLDLEVTGRGAQIIYVGAGKAASQ